MIDTVYKVDTARRYTVYGKTRLWVWWRLGEFPTYRLAEAFADRDKKSGYVAYKIEETITRIVVEWDRKT